MNHREFARLFANVQQHAETDTPIVVVLKNGDIVDVEDVKVGIPGGLRLEIHVGPADGDDVEDDEIDDEFDEDDE